MTSSEKGESSSCCAQSRASRPYPLPSKNVTQKQPPSRSSSGGTVSTKESSNVEDKRTGRQSARKFVQKLKPPLPPRFKKLARPVVGSDERLTNGQEHPTQTHHSAVQVLRPAVLKVRVGGVITRLRGIHRGDTESDFDKYGDYSQPQALMRHL